MNAARKKARPKPFRILITIVFGLMGFVVLVEAWDKAARYISWKTLTKDEIVKDAQTYIHNYIDVSGSVCLYVVDCSQGDARLKMIKDIPTWNLDTDKDIIWNRRFSKVCEGRVTNIGLAFVPSAQGALLLESSNRSLSKNSALARWVFYNDRFVPRLSRFQSGSFSQRYPFEQCTHENAVISIP